MIAFVKTDPQEDIRVLRAMEQFLVEQGLTCFFTEKNWKDLSYHQPFLYFRNPYLRITQAREILHFHYGNPGFHIIKSSNGEAISFYKQAHKDNLFVVKNSVSYVYPPTEGLPILIGLYRRPLYARLTLNSILHNVYSPDQKIYIIASQPNDEMNALIQEYLDRDPRIEAVRSVNNLGYALHNFGSKFFKIRKFFHFEDDGLLPENLNYHVPYWLSQLNYRSETSGFVSLRVSDQNYSSNFLKSNMFHKGKILDVPKDALWYYVDPPGPEREILPVGGVGCVVDAEKMYKDFKPPVFYSMDQRMIKESSKVCILNTPVYHIGANQEMDYPDYYWAKGRDKQDKTARVQSGVDYRTGETKSIDLQIDWSQSVND